MNIFQQLKTEIIYLLKKIAQEEGITEELNYSYVAVETPREASFGDLATNAAMVMSKAFSKKPMELATVLAKKLETLTYINKAEVAGAGFINMTLNDYIWYDIVADIIERGENFEYPQLGENKTVDLEFVSANPTGPMHIGHARAAVFGDIVGRLLEKTGYKVTREYYINDAGNQIRVLAQSIYLRYLEALGEDIGDIPKGLYPGDYLKPLGQKLVEQYGDSLKQKDREKAYEIISLFAINEILANIKSTLGSLDVYHDIFVSEKNLHETGKVDETIEKLRKRGLIYRGKLEPPKGKVIEDWEPKEQLLFKSTAFGDDSNRVVQKANGEYTYFSSDIAYTDDKINRGFDKILLILGADGHKSYRDRLISLAKALGGEDIDFDVLLYNLVNLMDGGVPIKMSKRAGAFVFIDDVIEEVGKDIIRFMMLNRKSTVDIEFDLQKVKEQSRENPVFYVQYAHARGCSVLRNVRSEIEELHDFDPEKDFDKQLLEKYLINTQEIGLIRKIAEYQRIVEMSAKAYEPHRIANYLYELSSDFHTLWQSGLKFIVKEDTALTKARVYLVWTVVLTLRSGFSILGINAIESL